MNKALDYSNNNDNNDDDNNNYDSNSKEGSITKKLGEWIKKLDISLAIGLLQKTTISGTARILRKVLGY